MGLASGLRLLVSERGSLSAPNQRLHRGGSGNEENGCLQVLRCSHLAGRVDHILTGDQAGADLERVSELAKRLDLVYVEMEPGDAVFFDSNLLHRSDQNYSENPRWVDDLLLTTPRATTHIKRLTTRVYAARQRDDAMIRAVGMNRFSDDPSDVSWLDPKQRCKCGQPLHEDEVVSRKPRRPTSSRGCAIGSAWWHSKTCGGT